MSIPSNIQIELWQHSVKTGEEYGRTLWRQHPNVPDSIMMPLTTVLVRYSYESVLDEIDNLPPEKWADASPDHEIGTFRGLMLTWVDPTAKQVFDCLIGELAEQESIVRAQAYRAELLQQFSEADHKEVIDFLVETDRRWFQNNYEQLVNRKSAIDRLRKVNLQVLREAVESRRRAGQMLDLFKGFAEDAAARKRNAN